LANIIILAFSQYQRQVSSRMFETSLQQKVQAGGIVVSNNAIPSGMGGLVK